MKYLSFLLVAALLGGCSSDDNNEANNTVTGDPGQLVEQLAAAQCRKILECCAMDELQQVFGSMDTSDQAACEAAIVSRSEAFLKPALQRALTDGTISLNEGAINGCISALDQRSCGDFQPLASADVLMVTGCSGVVTPELTLSGFCQDDFECDTGFCSRPAEEASGACKTPPALDEPCLNDRCGSTSLTCNTDDVCIEKLGAGEVCTRNADCESDLCSPDDGGELVCENGAEICTG